MPEKPASLFSSQRLRCCVIVLVAVDARADLSASQARKVISRIAGFELKSSEVRVKSISASSSSAVEVSAEIKTVLKFEADKDGRWRVAEIRTGQDRWESVDLIANALGTQAAKGDCNAPDPRVRGKEAVDPSVKRARCLIGHLLGVEIPSDAIRIQEVNPMPIPMASQPSATVVTWLRFDTRLTSDKSGWRVTELRTGNHEWVKLEPLLAAVNQQKQNLAHSELESDSCSPGKVSPRPWLLCRFRQAIRGDRLSEPSLFGASNSRRSVEPALQVSR